MVARLGDIKDTFGQGGANIPPAGGGGSPSVRDALRAALGAVAAAHADSASLTASLAKNRTNGQLSIKLDDMTLWVWSATSAAAADSAHIAPTDVAAGAGRWIRVDESAQSLADEGRGPAGAALADTSPTVTVAQGQWRVQPAASLTANRSITLGTAGAAAGDQIEFTRLDLGAFTLAFINGGAGAGTLFTMAVSKLGYARFQFDGTNWALRSFGVQ